MAAVLADQTEMVRWLLRQGADPRLKDRDGFSPLMLAVRDGKSGPVAELAPYHRESLDSALLLAALVGQTEVIDTLTNYGASVYARMEDGRTPLMVAAQNGHTESVKLLLDIGASRFSTDGQGRSATDIATMAGHPEIAALIARDPLPGEIALESPEEIAQSMDTYVDAATTGTPSPSPSEGRHAPDTTLHNNQIPFPPDPRRGVERSDRQRQHQPGKRGHRKQLHHCWQADVLAAAHRHAALPGTRSARPCPQR